MGCGEAGGWVCDFTAVEGGAVHVSTETTETPPCSPPADRELSDFSSMKQAPYLSHAHWGVTYMVLKGLVWQARGKFIEYR